MQPLKKKVGGLNMTKTKKINPWMIHLAKVRKENPEIKDVKKIAFLAKKTYKKWEREEKQQQKEELPVDIKEDKLPYEN